MFRRYRTGITKIKTPRRKGSFFLKYMIKHISNLLISAVYQGIFIIFIFKPFLGTFEPRWHNYTFFMRKCLYGLKNSVCGQITIASRSRLLIPTLKSLSPEFLFYATSFLSNIVQLTPIVYFFGVVYVLLINIEVLLNVVVIEAVLIVF